MYKVIITNDNINRSWEYKGSLEDVQDYLEEMQSNNLFGVGFSIQGPTDITAEHNKLLADRKLEIKKSLCGQVVNEIRYQFDSFSFEDKVTLKSRADISTIINALAIDGSLKDSYSYAQSIPTDNLLTQELKDAILTFWSNKITEYNNLGL